VEGLPVGLLVLIGAAVEGLGEEFGAAVGYFVKERANPDFK